jgi:DNA modification methylase
MSQLHLDLSLPYTQQKKTQRMMLLELLHQDLDFHGQDSQYLSHNFHSFPAKFPPQLPRKFIVNLTNLDDLVLDPMMGSGTTVLETLINGRRGIGLDIDPLAELITKVKLTPINVQLISTHQKLIVASAYKKLKENAGQLETALSTRWDKETKAFVDYWFTHDTQLELIALLQEIESLTDPLIKAFFQLAFSAIIITKSGGVSLALDLAHTRPHRAKVVIKKGGEVISGKDLLADTSVRTPMIKTLRPPIEEFTKKVAANLQDVLAQVPVKTRPIVSYGDAQLMPLPTNSIDLIVTSPPYASNAIDYMRAHKFSLVWLGFPIDGLSQKRTEYIGGENTVDFPYEPIPAYTTRLVDNISQLDAKKGKVLLRYYSEMSRVLREMYRVLKPGKSAVVVVGSSIIRNVDTDTRYWCPKAGPQPPHDAGRVQDQPGFPDPAAHA